MSGGEKIMYVDVCSLYPWVNKYGKYHIGHPVIITENFADKYLRRVCQIWRCTAAGIVPPRPTPKRGQVNWCLLYAVNALRRNSRTLGTKLRGTWQTDPYSVIQ